MSTPYCTAIKTDTPQSSSPTRALRNTSHARNFVSTHSTTSLNKESFIWEHLVSQCTANFMIYKLAWSGRSVSSYIHPWLQHLLHVNRLQNNSGRNGTAVQHSGHAGSRSRVHAAAFISNAVAFISNITQHTLPKAHLFNFRLQLRVKYKHINSKIVCNFSKNPNIGTYLLLNAERAYKTRKMKEELISFYEH